MTCTRQARSSGGDATDHLSPQEAALWRAYRTGTPPNGGEDGARNAIVEFYLPLVGSVAQRVAARVPGGAVGADELAGEGVFGLLQAIQSFDPQRGLQFSTHARHRIEGAMRDYLRSLDPISRLRRSRQRQIEAARDAFFSCHGRKPSEEETCRQMRLDAKQYRRVVAAEEFRGIYSLDAPRMADSDREYDLRDTLTDVRAADPMHEAMKRSLRSLLNQGLSRAERLIVVLYFYEKMTMREVGTTLGLSEARVSQMLTLVLARLKAQLHEHEEELVAVG